MSPRVAFFAGALSMLALVVAAVTFNSLRAEDWFVSTIGSQHLNGGDYCEANPGVGLESGDEVRTLVGVYRNSLCERWSFYVGKSWHPLKYGRWSLGGSAMAITGYESPVTLGLAMVMSYESRTWGVNLVWFPDKNADLTNGVIGLQVKRRW